MQVDHWALLDEELRLQQELDRRRAKESLLAFYMRMTGFMPPQHIKVMCKVLQAMEEDRIDRAMIFAPPRHAKTLVSSILFPAFLIGRHPQDAIMQVAHTDRYAKTIGGKVRNLMRLPQWPFDGVQLAQDSQAKNEFKTDQGGEYNGFGTLGGNQHGNPASWLFMDDIVKGRKMALSPHMRQESWETYTTDLLSRLQNRAKQLMVFTRWHQDDPAGRILPENFDGKSGWYQDRETGEWWFVLSMPAVAEHDNDPTGREVGEWLWPAKYGQAKLGGMRKRGGWRWSALYQQRPSPAEGLLFKPHHIRRFDPDALDLLSLKIYGSSDYATTQEGDKPDPDYTVHMIWGVDPEFNIYLLDMWRGRTETNEWIDQLIRLIRKWKPLRWGEEQGQIIKSVGPFLTMRLRKEHLFVNRLPLTSSVDKEMRAQSLLGMASGGMMYLPARDKVGPTFLSHLDAFEKELMEFPTGRHDDTVDAATLFGRMISRIIEGRRPKRSDNTPADSPHGATLAELFTIAEAEADAKLDDW
ncbi:MAG: phage terminase large subunit [Pseudomonadota bacterium]